MHVLTDIFQPPIANNRGIGRLIDWHEHNRAVMSREHYLITF